MSNETNKPESFAELFEQSLASQEMRQGEVITAEVVRVDYNFVVVNAGLKSEAYVPSSRATSSLLPSSPLKTATATRSFPATRPSASPPG